MAIVSGHSWQAGSVIALFDMLELDGTYPATQLQQAGADTDIPIAVATSAATDGSELSYELLTPGKVFSFHCATTVTALDKICCTTSGDVKTAAHGDHAFAIALETVTTSGVGKAVVLPGYYWAVDN